MRTATVKRNKWGCREEWYGADYCRVKGALVYKPDGTGETFQCIFTGPSGGQTVSVHPIAELDDVRRQLLATITALNGERWPPEPTTDEERELQRYAL